MFITFALFASSLLVATCFAAPTTKITSVSNETITTTNDTAIPSIRHRRQATLDSETTRAILLNAVPGVDYPAFDKPIPTSFQCSPAQGVLPKGGYYADMEAGCAMFHICANGYDYPMMCPKQTLFNQRTLTCDWFFEVNCPSARELYAISNQDVFTISQQTPQFYPSGIQQPIVYQQNLLPIATPQQFADAFQSANTATSKSDADLPCCASQQQPSGMLVLSDQAAQQQQLASSPAHAVVVLFVPMTAQPTDNFVNIVQPAEQISSQSMTATNNFNAQNDNVQKSAEDCVKTNDAAANTQNLQQDTIQQHPVVQQPQQILVRLAQPSAQTSDFLRTHQQNRNNRPLTDFDSNKNARSSQQTTSFNNNQQLQDALQQQRATQPQSQSNSFKRTTETSDFVRTHQTTRNNRPLSDFDNSKQQQILAPIIVQQQPVQPVQLREPTLIGSVALPATQNKQQRQSDFTSASSSFVQNQVPQQQQQQPIQQQQVAFPQQQQAFAGGASMGNALPGQGGALLGSMLSGISQPGGVFAMLGQLMNTGPQMISSALPIGTQFQTLLVPQVMGATSEQPALAVVNNCCQV